MDDQSVPDSGRSEIDARPIITARPRSRVNRAYKRRGKFLVGRTNYVYFVFRRVKSGSHKISIKLATFKFLYPVDSVQSRNLLLTGFRDSRLSLIITHRGH